MLAVQKNKAFPLPKLKKRFSVCSVKEEMNRSSTKKSYLCICKENTDYKFQIKIMSSEQTG